MGPSTEELESVAAERQAWNHPPQPATAATLARISGKKDMDGWIYIFSQVALLNSLYAIHHFNVNAWLNDNAEL